ncbi:MAG TPA: hypothetical protein VFF06_14765 [Polyangia bacterium]|nr:hypothetical protein [Polyangia bacterium]
MSINAHRAIRIISLLVFAGACGLAWHKLRRTPEQEDLTRYVEVEVPRVTASEQPIQERIDRLGQAPGLKPDEARTLLIDDVIPRLIRLRKQAEELATDKRTREVRALADEYLKVTDRLIDACRNCVHVIDDPKLSTVEGLKQVRARFAEVRQAYQDWDAHVQQACARHRLVRPAAPPR